MWKFNHDYLKYDLELTKYSLDGFKYQWYDGVFSVALGHRERNGYRKAYFHPMASISEFAVSTVVLQNEEASKRLDHGDDFKVYVLKFLINVLTYLFICNRNLASEEI